ncbi:MAG: hypothetical protein U0176_23685 [Bacteroidia bacterium]
MNNALGEPLGGASFTSANFAAAPPRVGLFVGSVLCLRPRALEGLEGTAFGPLPLRPEQSGIPLAPRPQASALRALKPLVTRRHLETAINAAQSPHSPIGHHTHQEGTSPLLKGAEGAD